MAVDKSGKLSAADQAFVDDFVSDEIELAASAWRMSSIRWLEENYPHYTNSKSTAPADRRLATALHEMSIFDVEKELGNITNVTGVKAEVVRRWSSGAHRKLIAYLTSGGYRARVESGRAEAAKARPAPKTPSGKPKKTESEESKAELDDAVQYSSDWAGSW